MDSQSEVFGKMSPNQLCAKKLGSANPSIQLLNLEERVAKIEAVFQSAVTVNKAIAVKVENRQLEDKPKMSVAERMAKAREARKSKVR